MVPDLPPEEMERRKRLYESAPALLEALEALVDEADEWTEGAPPINMDKARAAIKQAKEVTNNGN